MSAVASPVFAIVLGWFAGEPIVYTVAIKDTVLCEEFAAGFEARALERLPDLHIVGSFCTDDEELAYMVPFTFKYGLTCIKEQVGEEI